MPEAVMAAHFKALGRGPWDTPVSVKFIEEIRNLGFVIMSQDELYGIVQDAIAEDSAGEDW